MELIERTSFLEKLQAQFEALPSGEGRCVFISGEAGIGKTSLVRAFCRGKTSVCPIYQGTCDAFFTPRPLAPLHDILWQISDELGRRGEDLTGRGELFSLVLHELSGQGKPILLVFEDIHWADEATLDFIKFMARRITRLRCLFLLTYRDDEIHMQHPLRNVLGQIPNDHFMRLQLPPLSKAAVEHLAIEKGYNGEDVYSISGGNPFYVHEILASYSPGIPDNIKDSILSVYQRRDETTRHLWQLLSIMPTGVEMEYLEELDPGYMPAVEQSMGSAILVLKEGVVRFKHELYRRTIESSLSPFLRVSMNKTILRLFLSCFEECGEVERIVHHAKHANDYDLVVKYAPMAARQAAEMGAHQEAAKLYYTAIEYYQGSDRSVLKPLYEAYSYECYLTHQMKTAIIYQTRLLKLRQEGGSVEEIGDSMRVLSRLWWYDGHRRHAEEYAKNAIELLKDQAPSGAQAMAFSNMSQLNMLAEQTEECIYWGSLAIDIAQGLGNEEILCHALNNVGSGMVADPALRTEGFVKLRKSLEIALEKNYQDHVARGYTNLGCFLFRVRDLSGAKKTLEEGVAYCEARDLDSLSGYMQSWLAWERLESGHWEEAADFAQQLLKKEGLSPIIGVTLQLVIARVWLRTGRGEALALLNSARDKAFEAMELQRIGPVLSAMLEYEWITGQEVVDQAAIDQVLAMIRRVRNDFDSSRLVFWLGKARGEKPAVSDIFDGYRLGGREGAAIWERLGYPYEQALALFEGDEGDKRAAISIIQQLGGVAVYERMKLDMRSSGMRSIPRGMRKSTQSNVGLLTERELDVLRLLREGMQNKEIAGRLFIAAKTVDHHISAILFKLDVNSRVKAVHEAVRLKILD